VMWLDFRTARDQTILRRFSHRVLAGCIIRFLLSIGAFGLFLGLSGFLPQQAKADVLFTGNIPLVASGQNVLNTQTASNLWASGTGTLSFTGVGDFDDAFGERVDLYLDNIFIGTAGRTQPGTVFTPGTQPGMLGLHTIQATFTVAAATMQAILGTDTSVTFRMDLTPNVGANAAFTGDFVSARLSYSAVPEPSSLALLGLVTAGGFAMRRRFVLRSKR
jgi:hypothetical protein